MLIYNTYLYPDGIVYLLVKICILIMVLLVWWAANSAPVV